MTEAGGTRGAGGPAGAGPADPLAAALTPERVVRLGPGNKRAALEALLARLALSPLVKDQQGLAAEIFRREAEAPTALGRGLGVPHARQAGVLAPVMALGISPEGIPDYGAPDGEPVRLVFLVAVGPAQQAAYLELLAKLAGRLADAGRRRALLAAGPEEACRLLAGGGGQNSRNSAG